MNRLFKISFAFMFSCLLSSCAEQFLDVEPGSQYSSEFLETKEGVEAITNSAYQNILLTGDAGVNRIYVEESCTDVLINFRGLLNGNLQPFMDFTWSASQVYLQDFWRSNYRAIRDANLLLEAIPNHPQLDEATKTQLSGEMHFIRGFAYAYLYGWFGGVPLVSQHSDLFLPRAAEADIRTQIESDLITAAENLGTSAPLYGRATKGAALGLLAQYYLQTRQWEKASDAAQRVIDLQQYELWPDVRSLFALTNEGNKEMIYAAPALALSGYGNVWIANALPPGYPTNIMNTATQVCLPLAFYNSFANNDQRKALILARYTNNSGTVIDLTTGVEYQNPRSFKYPLDPAQIERHGGMDFPILRYAEILLIKAEADVMAGRSISDALYYLNQVHTRAGLAPYTSSAAPDQARFIALVLDERKWEFFSEGRRRQDLLRHDQFLQNAIDRGKSPQAFRQLFPIPQSEMDANPQLVQNEGY